MRPATFGTERALVGQIQDEAGTMKSVEPPILCKRVDTYQSTDIRYRSNVNMFDTVQSSIAFASPGVLPSPTKGCTGASENVQVAL